MRLLLETASAISGLVTAGAAVVGIALTAMGAMAALAATYVAWRALRVATLAFHRDHRPIIRVVRSLERNPHKAKESLEMLMDEVILKNIGRGPGLNVVLFDPRWDLVMGEAEAAEPLGSADKEQERPGRIPLGLRRPMRMDESFELYSQDVLGTWHLTRFRPRIWKIIECTFIPEIPDADVPATVRLLTTIRGASATAPDPRIPICQVQCLHCREWIPSPIQFRTAEAFFTSTLAGNTITCPRCRKTTGCNTENMRFRIEDVGFVGDQTLG